MENKANRVGGAHHYILHTDPAVMFTLQWPSGARRCVASWAALAAVTGRAEGTLRVYASRGQLASGTIRMNSPDNGNIERVRITRGLRAGRPTDPAVTAERLATATHGVVKAEANLAIAQARLELARAKLAAAQPQEADA